MEIMHEDRSQNTENLESYHICTEVKETLILGI